MPIGGLCEKLHICRPVFCDVIDHENDKPDTFSTKMNSLVLIKEKFN